MRKRVWIRNHPASKSNFAYGKTWSGLECPDKSSSWWGLCKIRNIVCAQIITVLSPRERSCEGGTHIAKLYLETNLWRSFYSVLFERLNLLQICGKIIWPINLDVIKSCVDQFDTISQFHQHFTSSFCADILYQNIKKPNCN